MEKKFNFVFTKQVSKECWINKKKRTQLKVSWCTVHFYTVGLACTPYKRSQFQQGGNTIPTLCSAQASTLHLLLQTLVTQVGFIWCKNRCQIKYAVPSFWNTRHWSWELEKARCIYYRVTEHFPTEKQGLHMWLEVTNTTSDTDAVNIRTVRNITSSRLTLDGSASLTHLFLQLPFCRSAGNRRDEQIFITSSGDKLSGLRTWGEKSSKC